MNTKDIDGSVRIAIDDDPDRVVSFVPDDVVFAERFYGLMAALKEKEADYQQRAAALEKNKAVDEYGIPLNVPESLALLRELCEFMRGEIDSIFGKGTSQKVFGEHLSLAMIEQFFNGITPYVQSARKGKTEKYTAAVVRRRQEIEQAKAAD